MNEKLTLDDLSKHIILKHNINKEESDRFLILFLKTVREGLICDRYVRIKGLGTFKLIENNVDVSHSSGKIVFVPESALKDAVNKPFAHFESIILNENVHFDDVEELVLSNNSVSETEVEENISNNVVESENEVETKVSPIQHNNNHNIRWYIILTLLVGFLLGAFVSWLVLDNKTIEQEERSISNNNSTENTVVEPVNKVITADSTINSEIFVENVPAEYDIVEKSEIDSILKVADIEKKENEKRNIDIYSEKLNYRIVGTIEMHVIKKGSTLAKIAYKYYKNKKMWPYIVMHNKEKIKDPNNVPIGTEINIPKLEVIE